MADGTIPQTPSIGGTEHSKLANSKPGYQVDYSSMSYREEYFSGCDVVILIGDIYVDDIITMQYTLTNNKSPIYGYMSEIFDAVAKGTRIVQGQFSIAFRETDYLAKILENYKRTTPGKQSQEVVEVNFQTPPIAGSQLEYTNTSPVDKFGYRPDAGYGEWIDRDGFDIIAYFGDPSGIYRGGTHEAIVGCHITSRSLVCEPTGEPIAEIYSFFGRALRSVAACLDLPSLHNIHKG